MPNDLGYECSRLRAQSCTETDEARARYKLSKTDAVGGTDSRVLSFRFLFLSI